ncbi:hypothetical protein ES703_116850 [subsurface metagenome]
MFDVAFVACAAAYFDDLGDVRHFAFFEVAENEILVDFFLGEQFFEAGGITHGLPDDVGKHAFLDYLVYV